MQVRELTEPDWPEMCRLRAVRKTHAGAPASTFTSSAITTVSDRYLERPSTAVGAFNGDTLRAYICAYAPENLGFWVLDLMVSDNARAIHPCLEWCLNHYEALGVNQFYYAFPAKWSTAYNTFWRDSVPPLRKYTIEDVSSIKARRIPDPWTWQHILHECLVPVDFLLRRSFVP